MLLDLGCISELLLVPMISGLPILMGGGGEIIVKKIIPGPAIVLKEIPTPAVVSDGISTNDRSQRLIF